MWFLPLAISSRRPSMWTARSLRTDRDGEGAFDCVKSPVLLGAGVSLPDPQGSEFPTIGSAQGSLAQVRGTIADYEISLEMGAYCRRCHYRTPEWGEPSHPSPQLQRRPFLDLSPARSAPCDHQLSPQQQTWRYQESERERAYGGGFHRHFW
jgi:hypothetical protein